MERTLIEAEEAFGAPAADERLDAAAEALLSCGRWLRASEALPLCFGEAEKTGHDSYFAALDASLRVARARAGSDDLPAALRAFFHAAARVGEARMLVHLAERVREIHEIAQEPA